MDQQGTQVAIPVLGHAFELDWTATAELPRYQAEPGADLTTAAKLPAITDSGNKSGSRQRTYTG